MDLTGLERRRCDEREQQRRRLLTQLLTHDLGPFQPLVSLRRGPDAQTSGFYEMALDEPVELGLVQVQFNCVHSPRLDDCAGVRVNARRLGAVLLAGAGVGVGLPRGRGAMRLLDGSVRARAGALRSCDPVGGLVAALCAAYLEYDVEALNEWGERLAGLGHPRQVFDLVLALSGQDALSPADVATVVAGVLA